MRLVSALFVSLLSAWPALADCDGRMIEQQVLSAPICVPREPKRVVVLDPFYNLGMSLELDVPVVGGPLTMTSDAALRERAQQVPVADIGDTRQPSLERIVSLEPDLIIGDATLHGEFYKTLASIAPTALIDVKNWKDHLATLAAVTGKTADADAAIAAYEDRVTDIRARMPANIVVSAIRVKPFGFHVYLDGPSAYAPFAVLREAHVKRTAYETTEDDTVLKRPDWEELAQLDGRILLYVVAAGNKPGQDDQLEAETVSNPFWQMLPAVRSGRAYRVDRAAWFGFNSVASANQILDDVERYILKTP